MRRHEPWTKRPRGRAYRSRRSAPGLFTEPSRRPGTGVFRPWAAAKAPTVMPARVDILPARYRDAELIGRGGMGEIFRALDEVLGRDVAVKLLAERFANEAEVRERFTREALTAARLSGEPNVVTIFDVGEHHGRPFIVMEHLGGGSLEDVLRREGAQPPGRALTWLEDAGRALDAAHAAGNRPPGRQAGEPAARRRRSRPRRRLRDRERGGPRLVHPPGHGARHRRLPLARAGGRGACDARERPLRARRRRVRAPVR